MRAALPRPTGVDGGGGDGGGGAVAAGAQASGLSAQVLSSSSLSAAPPVLSHACQLPLLGVERGASELLISLLLRSAHLPPVARLIEREAVGTEAVNLLQHQMHEVTAALGMGGSVPRLFLQEYAASRTRRLALWDALLRTSGDVARQLGAAAAVDRLVLTGALPYTEAFHLPLMALPAAFVPFHGGATLRNEGMHMLSTLLGQRHARPELFEQLLHVLQRDKSVQREVARLSACRNGLSPRSEREEALLASVVTLMLLLDSACELRLWQLMAEADAARAIFQIHSHHPEATAVPLPKLLEGEHLLHKPLGRAAATFVHALRDYERTHQKTHPLMTAAMRGGV